jgi:hypothetical protein
MVLDGAWADEQLTGDFSVRGSLRGKARDLLLLRRELIARVHGPFAGALAGRQQLAFGAARECLGAHACERLMRGAQMVSGVEAAPFASQPLPVKKVSPGELEPNPGTGEVHDRFAVQTAKHYLINSTSQINPKVVKKLKGNKGPAGVVGLRGATGLQGATGPQGLAGVNGKDGTNGTNGATKVTVKTATGAAVKEGELSQAVASCNPGDRVTGGGGEVDNDNVGRLTASAPNGIAWVARAWNSATGAPTLTVKVTAYVICASP